MKNDKSSFFAVEQKEKADTPIEVTMSDIAKRLRSVYAQMQMKYSPRHLTSQSSIIEENLKSYLDDISRAILVEHYTRCQKEKKLFEYLEQIKTLVQSLHSEKKILEEASVTRRTLRLKPSDSVVQHLAHMECEGNQERASFQEAQNFSAQNNITPISTHAKNNVLEEGTGTLHINAMKPSFKNIKDSVERSAVEKKCSDVQAVGHSIGDDQSPSLSTESIGFSFFSRYLVKKIFLYFLIIVFMAAIALSLMNF